MQEKTRENVYKAFVGEAKAYFRLLAYAEKAREEGEEQAELLFKAIAEAERVHASNHLNLLQDIVIKDTETNLLESFNREVSISENEYPDFVKDAEQEGEQDASLTFSRAKDAEKKHAKLYDQAMYHVMKDEVKEYYVCQVCGYVNESKAPKKCPVCGADREEFKEINA